MIIVQFPQHFAKNALLNRAKIEKSLIIVQFSQHFAKNALLNRAKSKKSLILVQFFLHFFFVLWYHEIYSDIVRCFMKNIRSQLNKYNKELEAIHSELETLPPGRLAKNGKTYTHIIDNKRFGITKKPALIQQLARKKYLLARKKQLSSNIQALSNPNIKYDSRLPQEIIATFSETYRSLPLSYFYHPSIATWLEDAYDKNTLYQENLIYSSKNGIHLRSKSERDIANLLEEYQIPYRYDAIIRPGGIKTSPDFIIKNPYTNKTIIWEHFGFLHEADYEQNMNDKIDRYLSNGFTENEHFIYTFEAHTRDLSRVQNLIESMIL